MNPLAEIQLEDGAVVATGWLDDPAGRQAGQAELVASGHDLSLSRAAPHLFGEPEPEKSVFLWEAEEAVVGRLFGVWNQNPIGSCVGFGSTRAAQDVLLNEIAAGEPEEWPGAELCPEVTYVGSRNEAWPENYRPIPARDDGSVGVAAANWFTRFGAVKRGVYGGVDLTRYNREWTRANQGRGVPSEVEAEGKLHPITTAALLRTFDDFWAAMGARKGVYFCSVMGFRDAADSDGFAVPSGRWGHCQVARGRAVVRKRGAWVRAAIGQNSWLTADGGRVIHPSNGPVSIETKDRGRVTLPPGCVAYEEDVFAEMLTERDSFALAGLTGWRKLTLNWNPLA